jgi:hypothetical protein
VLKVSPVIAMVRPDTIKNNTLQAQNKLQNYLWQRMGLLFAE